MRRLHLYIIALVSFTASAANSQGLHQVTFSNTGELQYFSLLTDREVLIRISKDGRLMEWGVEVQSTVSRDYYAPKLQPYMGRVEYYGQEADSLSRGKIRSIGTAYFTYYGGSDTEEKRGRIRTIGSSTFDYFGAYDNKALLGKIKLIGSAAIDYYPAFENEAITGKVKSIGSTTIQYYSSFDDKLIRGKIKSIGSQQYTLPPTGPALADYSNQAVCGNLSAALLTSFCNKLFTESLFLWNKR
jgi:hypothetical protein